MARSKSSKTETVKEKEKTFTKEQIVKSKKYSDRQDALNALLAANKKYTLTQVDEKLKQFYKGGRK